MKRTLTILSAALLLTGFTSCSDYLDILPLNDVVLENYWTEKNDVTSVLNSCYESLENSESVTRMAIWGELRSENIVAGNFSNNNDLADALRETLLPSSRFTLWSDFYRTINRCNTVIHYAPGVQEIDPNYKLVELQATIAEATFIRDLCYFYLLRTFGGVPMVFAPSIGDDIEFEVAPTAAFTYQDGKWEIGPALDMLINDLKSVEDKAVRRYYDDNKKEEDINVLEASRNSSRVTRYAIYALLAELNLWKGDFDETIHYCDLIIDYKKEQYEERKAKLGSDLKDIELFNEIPLITECPAGGNKCGNAQTKIFGKGNSFESIFELYFTSANTFINNYYRTKDNGDIAYLAALNENRKDVISGSNTLFSKDDCRAYGMIDNTTSRATIAKYVASSVSMSNRLKTLTDEKNAEIKINRRGNDEPANWIIYRLTDIMLMKAEALVFKGAEYYEQAFNLVDAVNRRARKIDNAGDPDALNIKNYNSDMAKMMEDLILQERKREFMFEGKRWYDLARYSIRVGNNNYLSRQVTAKYEINVSAIQIKLSNPYTLFWPINKEELKLNSNLKQNPAYGDTEDFQR